MLYFFGLILLLVGSLSAARSAGTTTRATSVGLTCRDLYGKPVEWFTSIKMPKITSNTQWPDLRSGAAVVYQDVTNPGKWRRASALITDPSSHIAYTLAPLYTPGYSNLTYVLYNDQPPPDRRNAMYKGHAKGLIIFDGTSGLWLIHSVPGFPPPASGGGTYEYPSSGHLYGQSFLCLSLSASQLNLVATQLYYNDVNVYDKNVATSTLGMNPHLRLLLEGSKSPPPPFKSTLTVTTVNGTQFVSFAKDGKFRQDLYDQAVAPYLQTDLTVEAWRNGNGNLPSDCNDSYSVMNVNMVHFDVPTDLDRDVIYETNNDHSKWAVSSSANKPWACVGDINRQYGQFKRGGGTVCLSNPQVWKSYFDLVSGIDPCELPQASRVSSSSSTTRTSRRSKSNGAKKRKGNKQVMEINDEVTVTQNVVAAVHVEKRCRSMDDGTVRCQEIVRKSSKKIAKGNELGNE